jgi:Icc-related predicted phosphoesterase
MRILAVADLHYALRQFDWLGAQVGGFDMLVLAGDLLDLSSAVEPEVQAVVVQKYLRRFAVGKPLLATSGNHDILDEGTGGERAARWLEDLSAEGLRADYDSYERDGVLFTLCPWWDGPETRARAEARLAEDAARPRRAWVWLHHNPPANTPVAWTGRHDGGDSVLVEWLRRHEPDYVFSGHIHNAPFYAEGAWHCRFGRTWVFNAGRQPGGEPARVVLDLAARRAEWHSMEGRQSVSLDTA